MSQLPVRTHEQRAPRRELPPHSRPGYVPPKRSVNIIGKGGKARKVRIKETVYDSVTDACRIRKMSPKTVYDWLRTGEAEYV